MKQVLVIHYSQSGQLTDILNRVIAPLKNNDAIYLNFYNIAPRKDFDFPWKQDEFFDTFPETFLQIPQELQPTPASILNKKYDLIILGYQVWFLTPSIPINSFLQSQIARKLMENTPLITVIGCRNLWIMAQEKMKKRLLANKANLVGHIVLADRHPNHISVITISHWMFSGKKDRYLGIFPKPGVSEKDIEAAIKFGQPIKKSAIRQRFSFFTKGTIRTRGSSHQALSPNRRKKS